MAGRTLQVVQQPLPETLANAGWASADGVNYDRKKPRFALGAGVRAQSSRTRWDQASCWSMKAVSWALLMAPTLVAAS